MLQPEANVLCDIGKPKSLQISVYVFPCRRRAIAASLNFVYCLFFILQRTVRAIILANYY